MPELPDVTVYVEAVAARVVGQRLTGVRIAGPFLLRTIEPALEETFGRRVERVERVGKRIAIGLEGGLWLTIHLMIAGRLHWRAAGAKVAGRNGLAGFDFETGTLTLTEAGSQRRASLMVANRLPANEALDVMTAGAEEFRVALTAENHTLKRALTDPQVFDGIGNAYSDEILHRAKLSPAALTQRLGEEEIERLRVASVETLGWWIDLLRREAGEKFPEKVTAFRKEMAVHGKFGEACPVCGGKVRRIRYASNETNYCAECQTGGRVLADRSLSRLLGPDWLKRTT